MSKYKLCNGVDDRRAVILKILENGFTLCIPFDPANTDYQAYLKWLEEGNTPEPADEQGAA